MYALYGQLCYQEAILKHCEEIRIRIILFNNAVIGRSGFAHRILTALKNCFVLDLSFLKKGSFCCIVICLAKCHIRISIFKITFLIAEIFQLSDYVEVCSFVLILAFKHAYSRELCWWNE